MRKRWLKVLLLFVVSPFLVLALVCLVLVFERIRGKVSLARYQRALAAQGEILAAKDLLPAASGGENGALAVVKAADQLKAGNLLPRNYPPRMKFTAAGRAVVCFREPDWFEEGATNTWDQLAGDLEPNRELLDQVRKALEKPVQDNQLNYSVGARMALPHLSKVKSLVHWFGSATQLALQDGDKLLALNYVTAQIQLPRLLAQDHVLISELVRNALASIARTDTWEALQAEGWTDSELARLQQAWETQAFLQGMIHGLEGERVFYGVTFKLHAQLK